MSTKLLRNSLLATSTPLSKSKDLSKTIPPQLPNLRPQRVVVPQNNGAPIRSPSSNTPPQFNKKATLDDYENLYKDLQSDAGREAIGSDPLLQRDAIDKVNQFLTKFPRTIANTKYDPNADVPWTELPVKELYKNTIKTLIDIINEVSITISESEVDGSVATRRKIVDAFFKKDRRLYVGFLFIFISFVLYFIDSDS
jgi:hypothetical protein